VENPYAAPHFPSPCDWVDDDKEISCLVAELDCGLSPPDVLVVREAKWQRAMGAVLGFLIGIPATFAAAAVAWRYGDIGSALLFSVFAVVPLCAGVRLLNELLCATYYYIALDAQHFYRRRGPSQLLVLRLVDLNAFDVPVGTLCTYHKSGNKRINVIKKAYAPEDINVIARRLNAWREAPAEERVRHIKAVDLLESQRLRTSANRQIARALRTLCIYPFLLVLSVQLRLSNAGILAIILWSVFAISAFWSLFAGIISRISATSQETLARRNTDNG
jgi:hypothetical protein